MTARVAVALAALACLAGCGRYADFSLPPLAGGDPRLTFQFDPLPQPVLSRGDSWDSQDALAPAMVDGRNMLYSGFDGRTWRTGMASSEDGVLLA